MKKYKVAIGSIIVEGPWGGGNLFAKNLWNFLEENNFSVVNDLLDNDIDLILLTEPRFESESSSISSMEAWFYKKFVNKNVKIIQRINECDERKNTNYVNKRISKINKKVDYTIYVSDWLRSIYKKYGLCQSKSSVILSGSDKKIFNNNNFKPKELSDKAKLVTHHWGNDWNKGFTIYKKIDDLLDNEEYSDKLEFAYIGNIPKNFQFKNTKLIGPLSGHRLASEIKKNNIYITASINEPSGNHHIEGALCGLPVLYVNSGGIPEYCEDYGVMFEENNFEQQLNEIINNYTIYYKKNLQYKYDSDRMCLEYKMLFLEILDVCEVKKSIFKLNIFNFKLTNLLTKIIKNIFMKIEYQFRKISK